MIPRFGEPVASRQKYTLRPGAYAILPHQGDVLLTVQTGETPDLQLPGGGIDPGESPVQGLHREVFEETGWRITAPRRLGAFRRFTYMPEYDLHAEKLCTVYLAKPVRQLAEPSEPDHEAVWVPIADAAGLLGNAGDRAFLARFHGRWSPV